jgi:tRNA(fMet)-specific endonuclease VapC
VTRYCLDTSAYSHFMRGHEEVTARIDSAAWVGVPAVVLGELWLGFRLGSHAGQNEWELREFLANPAVEILPVDHAVAEIYGEVVAALRRRGTPLPTNDVWIAATAARAGSPVLTFDRHFRTIERVGSIILED